MGEIPFLKDQKRIERKMNKKNEEIMRVTLNPNMTIAKIL
jgi:hypothetical protein